MPYTVSFATTAVKPYSVSHATSSTDQPRRPSRRGSGAARTGGCGARVDAGASAPAGRERTVAVLPRGEPGRPLPGDDGRRAGGTGEAAERCDGRRRERAWAGPPDG